MELHPNAEVWEELPTETLEAEHERISEQLADLISRSETIELIISERAEYQQNNLGKGQK